MTVGCPTPGDLVLYAVGDSGESPSDRIARHVTTCRSCESQVRRMRDAAASLQSVAARGPGDRATCLDELTIASFVDGDVPAEDRPAVIAHLADCPRCRGEAASVGRLLHDSSVAAAQTEVDTLRHARRGPAGHRRSWVAAAGAMAAVAASLVVLVARRDGRPGDVPAGVLAPARPVFREQAITTTGAPRLIAPAGAVPRVDTLRWSSVPTADRYRVTVFNRDGGVALEEETADTTLALPPALGGAQGKLYLWRVEARTGWDRWVESELVEFTISGAGQSGR